MFEVTLPRALVALAMTVPVLPGAAPVMAEGLPTVRLALLQFGTVNWEADTILAEGLDRKHGFRLEVVPFAGNDATHIALLGGDVQIATGDWLWASRQRASGARIVFLPYSTSMGAVVAPCDAGWDSLDDLEGSTIGVAGGPLDKGWLMLQGMAKGELGFDLKSGTTQAYGAPPLIAEKLRQGELDAALNYWHLNVRLHTEGFCEVVSAQEAAEALGAEGPLSAIGYLLDEDWASANPEAAEGFVAASREAKALLATSDAAWERLRAATRAENEAVFQSLKAAWRAGIPSGDIDAEERDTARVYGYLAQAGGEALVGSATEMAPGTFWSPPSH